MKKLILAMALFYALLLPCFSQEEDATKIIIESKDIRCKEYFYKIEPWKDGKLATIDGL